MTSRYRHCCALLIALFASATSLTAQDTSTPSLPPFAPEVEWRLEPKRPVAGKPLAVTIALSWEGGGPTALKPLGWGNITPLEPLKRSETARREVREGSVRTERLLKLEYRALLEGEVDLSPILLQAVRGEQVDTVKLPEFRVAVGKPPVLPWWGWVAVAVGIAAVAVMVRFLVVIRKRKEMQGEKVDPAALEAERWRTLKGELRQSEERRSWLGEVHDLVRERLIREGGDPAARTEALLQEREAKLAEEDPLRPAWKLVRREVIHYLYGGGLRPVRQNRETLRALQLVLGLNEEEVQ